MVQEKHLSKRRSKLSAAKRALLEKRLRGEFEEVSRAHVIRPRQEPDLFPLSFAQERLWFLDQLEPGNPAYNRPMALRLTGSLNVKALQQALSEILQRHEVLRATFPSVEGRPAQIITQPQSQDLPVVDLSEQSPNEREARALQLVTEEAQKPFDLSKGPLLRATLLRLDKEEHILLLVIQHIVIDAWSAKVFTDEILELYEAFSKGKPSPLPDLPIQYADFAHWQRQWLKGEVLETQLSYWEKKLAGSPPTLNLPTDRPRPTIQTFCGSQQSLIVSSYLYKSLKTLSRQKDATLFMTLFAAFLVLLHRYTGQDDIVVGTPIGGRSRIETEGLIGFFVNTLALRTDLSGNLTFQELLARVYEIALEAYEHQDVPFEKLVEELQPERDMSRTPLFQVMFNLENLPRRAQQIQGLRMHELELVSRVAPFDLTLEIIEKDEGLSCVFGYNTDLFDSSTIERMAGHFEILLEGIVANPAQRISELPLLTAAERHQLLVEWNDTMADYPEDKCIHELFETYARITPDAIAVVFENEQISYKELNQRSNQLAHYLKKLGTKPEVPIGICLERSLEIIVGLMAVLKAGGAYVPLDPTYPYDRLSFMIEDAGITLMLTRKDLNSRLPENSGNIVYLEDDWRIISQESDANPTCDARPENMAYIMYTSGTTGKPKGVMVTHRNVVGFLCSYKQVTRDGKRRIGTSVAPFSFDTSVEEIFSNLCFGGTLHIVRPENSADTKYFADYLVDNHITTTYIIPNFITGVAEHLEKKKDRLNLKCLITGLSPKKQSVLQLVRNFSEEVRILNAYGPTEVTYGATAFDFRHADDPDRDTPIGKPFPNYEVYIVDSHLQPVPIGVVGELLIGGVGLTRGYLNRRELTLDKFIPNPFSKEAGTRLYKTGDFVRYLPDGNIEFLGRIDHQVKVRGFRIELGEIESVLRQHSAVRETVVIAREDQPGDKRLVAYVVPRQNAELMVGELRNLLQRKLPSYMMPSAFVILDALPLMPNGKIDRKALPEPDSERPDVENPYVGPRTPTEELLAGIWCEVIGLKKVGINDNFFELGGHSLLATQIVSRLRNAFQIEISLKSFFGAPTVADLSVVIVQNQIEKFESKDIERTLAKLEALSDGETRRLFSNERENGGSGDEKS